MPSDLSKRIINMSITTQQNDDNAQVSLDRLALDTLSLSRNELLVKLRFLDVALSSLEPVRLDGATIATDGRHIIYDPRHVLRRYKLAKEAPVRDYLHMVLHCVFRHMFVDPTMATLKSVRVDLSSPSTDPNTALEKQIDKLRNEIKNGKLASTLSADKEYSMHKTITALGSIMSAMAKEAPEDNRKAFQMMKAEFERYVSTLKKQSGDTGKHLSNVFRFCEDVFGDGQEMLILVTELTLSYYCSKFISLYGCKEYFTHNKELLFYERQLELTKKLDEFEL